MATEPVLTVVLLIVSDPFPVFVSVTVWVGLVVPTTWTAKLRLVGESITAGCVPTPVRERLCGLEVALSVTFNEPASVPLTVGLKVSESEQEAPGARVLGQLMDCE